MKTKVPYTQVELDVAERGGLSYTLDYLVEAVKLAGKEGYSGDKAPEFFEKMRQIRSAENDDIAFLWLDFIVVSQDFPRSWDKALKMANQSGSGA
jgi:hypothetical protein